MLILVIFRGFGKFADRSQMADSVTEFVHWISQVIIGVENKAKLYLLMKYFGIGLQFFLGNQYLIQLGMTLIEPKTPSTTHPPRSPQRVLLLFGMHSYIKKASMNIQQGKLYGGTIRCI